MIDTRLKKEKRKRKKEWTETKTKLWQQVAHTTKEKEKSRIFWKKKLSGEMDL